MIFTDDVEKLKESLRQYAQDLRACVESSVGSLQASKYVDQQHFSMWQKLVASSIKNVSEKHEKLRQKIEEILSEIDTLLKKVKLEEKKIRELDEANRKKWYR